MLKDKLAGIAKRKFEWPDCAPLDKSDPCWEFNNNCSINGTPYEKQEVEAGRWQWVVNEKAVQRQREYQQRKDDLWWALRTRVLTDEEMAEVRRHDYHLLTRNMQSYREEEVRREFNDALMKQAYLQLDAKRDSDTRPKAGDAEQAPLASSAGRQASPSHSRDIPCT